MDIHALKNNKKLLAIIVGVAILATTGLSAVYAVGDTNSTQPQIQGSINLQQIIQSNIKTSFVDAANTAASSVTNGKVIGGSLTMIQGSVVYQFHVIDDKNMMYSVIVDAGNGSVLYTSPGHEMKFGGFGMGDHGMKMHKFHMGGFGNWQKQAPAPSSTTPSDFQE